MTEVEQALLTKIRRAVAKANEAEKASEVAKVEHVLRSKAVGQLLLEAKKLHPKVADFEAFLKQVDGLKLSRAYDMMRLAGGRTTDEQLRQETRERVQKHRAKKKLPRREPKPEPTPVSVTSPNVTESISVIERERQNPALADERAAKASAQALAEFTIACRHWLPKITVQDDRRKAIAVVAGLVGDRKAEAA